MTVVERNPYHWQEDCHRDHAAQFESQVAQKVHPGFTQPILVSLLQDWFIAVCPAGGKTTYSGLHAGYVQEFYAKQDIRTVTIFISPAGPINTSAKQTYIGLDKPLDMNCLGQGNKEFKKLEGKGVFPINDHAGVCVTYALASSRRFRALVKKWRDQGLIIVFVLDESHHLALESNGGWSKGIRELYELCTHCLSMSGTPNRQDRLKIPFAKYNPDGTLKSDFKYTYANALMDRIVRRMEFRFVDAEVDYMDGEYDSEEIAERKKDRLSMIETRTQQEVMDSPEPYKEPLMLLEPDKKPGTEEDMIVYDNKNKAGSAMRLAMRPQCTWLSEAVKISWEELKKIRTIPNSRNAACLVVSPSDITLFEEKEDLDTGEVYYVDNEGTRIGEERQAELDIVELGWMELIKTTIVLQTGCNAGDVVIIEGGGPKADAEIEKFRNSNALYIISKRKVTEGVNIPRIQVELWCRAIWSDLEKDQLAARATRNLTQDPDSTAVIIMPDIISLRVWAKEIENEINKVALDDKTKKGGSGGGERKSNYQICLSGTANETDMIFSGDSAPPWEIARAEKHIKDHNIVGISVSAVIKLLRTMFKNAPEERGHDLSDLVPVVATVKKPRQDHIKELRGRFQDLINIRATMLAKQAHIDKPSGEHYTAANVWARKRFSFRDKDDLFDNFPIDHIERILEQMYELIHETGKDE